MRKLIFLALVCATVLSMSCSKDEIEDFTKPENLIGTTWKYTSVSGLDDDLDYALLIFTSSTAVEGWTKYKNESEQKDWTGSFSILNNSISVTYEDEQFAGIIDGKTISLIVDGETKIFIKQ